MKIIRLLSLFFFLAAGTASAQDVHFSLPAFSPLFLNPAQTGAFNGDHRFSGIFRQQWKSVPVPYMTGGISWDAPVYGNLRKDNALGLGVLALYDRAGDGRLSRTAFQISISYNRKLAKRHFVGMGFQAGLTRRSFDPARLSFDNQWNGDNYDPNLGSGENFTRTSFLYPDLSCGLHWMYDGEKVQARLGGALFHLNRPNQTFYSANQSALPFRWTAYTDVVFPISNKMDISINAIFQQQDAYRETLAGAGLRYHLNKKRGRELSIFAGSRYRFGDAVIAYGGLEYQNAWQALISYDINTSGFNDATNGRGGPEIAVIYIIHKHANVERLPTTRICPVF